MKTRLSEAALSAITASAGISLPAETTTSMVITRKQLSEMLQYAFRLGTHAYVMQVSYKEEKPK